MGFEILEKAIEQHDVWSPWLAVMPVYEPLRSDPRCKTLIEKMNLDK
jgi:hypothetical protein